MMTDFEIDFGPIKKLVDESGPYQQGQFNINVEPEIYFDGVGRFCTRCPFPVFSNAWRLWCLQNPDTYDSGPYFRLAEFETYPDYPDDWMEPIND